MTGEAHALPLQLIKLPPGFEITVYADHVPGARSMAFGERGTLFIGTSGEGKVYAIPAHEKDTKVKVKPITLAKNLQTPTGVAFHEGALYVAERTRILRFDDVENQLDAPPVPLTVYDRLPADSKHGLRTIHFGPDGWLYIAIGAPCNVCIPQAPYANITRIDLANWPPQKEVVAQGVRNSLAFDWDPRNQQLWFADNTASLPGSANLADELNHLEEPGGHFGFPFCHSGEALDARFGVAHDCAEFVAPALQLTPHSAPLGMRFYTGDQFPEPYRNAIFIAEHGSLDDAGRPGFRVSVVTAGADETLHYDSFATGWLRDDKAWGRPADVIVAPDGALLVSDDQAGVVYRIAYGAQ